VGRIPAGAWYEHRILGWNYRLTEFQGALLLSQMRRLEEQIAKREENAAYLSKLLSEIDGIRPLKRLPKVTTHAWHLYIFRYDASKFMGKSRASFLKALNAEGIPCSAGYVPLYKEEAFPKPEECPVACRFAGRPQDYSKVSLPVTEHACAKEAVWIGQSVLLGTRKDMEDIAAAVAKIQENAAELPDG